MYIFVIKQGYRECEFSFDDYFEGCKFMMMATEHCNEEITFVVYKKTEEEGVEDEE